MLIEAEGSVLRAWSRSAFSSKAFDARGKHFEADNDHGRINEPLKSSLKHLSFMLQHDDAYYNQYVSSVYLYI